MGSSNCLVSLAVSLLLTNEDSESARLEAAKEARSFSLAFNLYRTLKRRKILACGASSDREDNEGTGDRLREDSSSPRSVRRMMLSQYVHGQMWDDLLSDEGAGPATFLNFTV